MKSFFLSFGCLSFAGFLLIPAASAEVHWFDFQADELQPALLHRGFPAVTGAQVPAGDATLTLVSEDLDARTRTHEDEMLRDFAFADGSGRSVTLEIAGFPAGSYVIESWHFDSDFSGAVRVEFARDGEEPEILVADHPFSTEPAVYEIEVDGASTYELAFRENDANNRARLNGLRIRPAGTESGLPGTFVDVDPDNTSAVGGSPDPFYTDDSDDPGFTDGNLWLRREGFGFNVTGNRETYEKNASEGFGDAAPLETAVTGLNPGEEVGVFVAYISVPAESWRVRAGLSPDDLTLFTPEFPAGRIVDLGPTAVTNSNRNQYLGFVGNAAVDPDGRLVVYSADGEGRAGDWSTRTWLEGFLIGEPVVTPSLPEGAVEIAPDGAWTWFNDERAIVHEGSLFSGYVKSNGEYGVTRYDFENGEAFHSTISTPESAQVDDHNNPSLTVLPDGRLLALYSKHIAGSQFYQRTSNVPRPAADGDWGSELVRPTPAANTYANTYRLTEEDDTIYNFHRSINFNPTLSVSTDLGESWEPAVHFIRTGSGGTRPYTRFTSNGEDRIDLIYTDGHPRDVANSLYHLYYHDGDFRRTDGSLISQMEDLPIDHGAGERGSVVYQYRSDSWGRTPRPDDWIPEGRAWNWDVQYDPDGHPVCVFQVRVADVTGSGWNHNRIYYYYARWTGSEWQRRFIAHAGRPLYSAEGDYGGGMTLDPEDPRIVYLSSNAAEPFALDEITNVPLRDEDRYELWRGFTPDGGETFEWTQLTMDSAADNLRPFVPEDHGRTEAVIWFHGTYNSYTNYAAQVLGRLGEPAGRYEDWVRDAGYPGEVAPGDDTTGNGLANLLEYGFGAEAGQPVDILIPRLTGGALEFSLDRSRTDVEWRIVASDDLNDWETVAVIRAAGLPATTDPGLSIELPKFAGVARLHPESSPLPDRRFYRVFVRSTR